ncbi:MAG: hypothetical protein J1E41_03765 [Ruminococcus sp.]|nr:hypothetical protein [Ruminococcus sp.]
MIFRYKIADIVFDADIRYRNTYNQMKDYLADDEPASFLVEICDEDIEREKKFSPYELSDYLYESTAVYRKFIYKALEKFDAFFFHCSSIAVDNKAIMFTAQSGTGKSTHRNLWLKNYGDKVTVINDDKPIIRKVDGVFYVYGTPWQGKEGMGLNIRVPAHSLCFLSRSEKNYIGPISTSDVVSKVLNQTVRPTETELMGNLLDLLDGFLNQVNCYDLRVNMDDEAAKLAYNEIVAK